MRGEDPVLRDPGHMGRAHGHAAAVVDADRADLRVHAIKLQRGPTERRGLIRPAVQELDVLRVDSRPVRAREARAGRHGGSEVEEAFAPDLRVGGDDHGCG